LDDGMGRVTTRVRRTRLDVATGNRVERTDTVAVEEPLEIRVSDEPVTTTMRTPGDDFDLAIGHLLTEAMLHSAGEVGTLMHCTDLDEAGSPTFNVVDVTLAPGAELHRPARERSESGTSACGVCGSASIEAVRTSSRFAVGDDAVAVRPEVLAGLPGALRARQPVFDRTGGVHAAGLATAEGELLVVREDVGRHNAVDKVVGALARERELPFAGTVLVVSARASFEIVQKASVTGIPVVVAVGAPSSLAVDLAAEAGITLVAFARPPHLSVYSRPDRLVTGRGDGTGQ
jgi:FdhD protein